MQPGFDLRYPPKEAKVRAFAERLFKEGGSAVDQVKMLFGEKIAGELIVEHMYGV